MDSGRFAWTCSRRRHSRKQLVCGGVNPLGFSPALLRGGDGRLYSQSYHSWTIVSVTAVTFTARSVHSRAADPDTLHFHGPAAARARSMAIDENLLYNDSSYQSDRNTETTLKRTLEAANVPVYTTDLLPVVDTRPCMCNGTHVQKWCHVLPPKDCNPMESMSHGGAGTLLQPRQRARGHIATARVHQSAQALAAMFRA